MNCLIKKTTTAKMPPYEQDHGIYGLAILFVNRERHVCRMTRYFPHNTTPGETIECSEQAIVLQPSTKHCQLGG